MRDHPRRRRAVGPLALRLLRPVFRYSAARDAYVLRVASGRYGPVLIDRSTPSGPAPTVSGVAAQPGLRKATGRFARTGASGVVDGSAERAGTTQTRQHP